MGITGKNTETFTEANYAYCDEMNLNSNYPHKLFDVVRAEGKTVTLRSHGDGSELTFKIRQERNEHREYAVIHQSSSYEKLFGRRPAKFKIFPMKGERF